MKSIFIRSLARLALPAESLAVILCVERCSGKEADLTYMLLIVLQRHFPRRVPDAVFRIASAAVEHFGVGGAGLFGIRSLGQRLYLLVRHRAQKHSFCFDLSLFHFISFPLNRSGAGDTP